MNFAGFVLQHGIYQPLSPDDRGRLISQTLGLALVRWNGFYKNAETTWLRWETLEGVLLPTPEEAERQRAELNSYARWALNLKKFNDRGGCEF